MTSCLRTILRLCQLVILFFISLSFARPDTIGLSVEATAGAGVQNQAPNSSQYVQNLVLTPIVVPTQTASASYSISGASWAASASVNGTVNFGSITNFTQAAAIANDPSAQSGAIGVGGGSGDFYGIWEDALTVTSATLSSGSPVNLLFTLSANGNLDCAGPGASVQAVSDFFAGAAGITLSDNQCNSAFLQTETLSVPTYVGATIALVGDLHMTATASPVNFITSTATIDPPSSSFFIDSMTPGASYVTDSGNTYFSPAVVSPEPQSAWLMAIGGVGTLFLTFRRRSKNPRRATASRTKVTLCETAP
jgi:hypothetical protein